jgi:hypothetical protein
MLIENTKEIKKLDRQLQGQLLEALELLKDVVEEMRIFAPEAIIDVKAAVWQIFNETDISQKGF